MHGWWGLIDPKSDLPTFSFAPLTIKTIDKFSGHVCGDGCLQRTLQVLAGSVDMKKAAVAGAKPETSSWPGFKLPPMFGFMGDVVGSDASDNVGYYKKKKDKEADDDEENY